MKVCMMQYDDCFKSYEYFFSEWYMDHCGSEYMFCFPSNVNNTKKIGLLRVLLCGKCLNYMINCAQDYSAIFLNLDDRIKGFSRLKRFMSAPYICAKLQDSD